MARPCIRSGRRTPVSDELGRRRQAALADLEAHWGSAYIIWTDEQGNWRALSRLDPKGPLLSALSEPELRLMIRADYDKRNRG